MLKILSAALASVMLFFSSLYIDIANPKTAELPENIVRDNTPKKYFTLSFDDGITQDYKIMEICRKYNFKGITFNINSGLCGANWEWVADMIGVPGTAHQRLTKEELKNGAYDGFDVAAHTVNHASMCDYDNNPAGVFKEVQKDAFNLEKLTGTMPLGMAWPGGDSVYTEQSIENVYKYTTIRYARGTTPTYSFALPERFLKWEPTCSIVESNTMSLAKEFIEAEPTEDMLFYVWGHGYELDAFNLYDTLEQLIKMMSEDENIVCVSNTEFYLLFKDQIPSK